MLALAQPLQQRLAQLSRQALNLGLPFEESRQRLRWIYETVQTMKVVETAPARRRPLLHRLFNVSED